MILRLQEKHVQPVVTLDNGKCRYEFFNESWGEVFITCFIGVHKHLNRLVYKITYVPMRCFLKKIIIIIFCAHSLF